LIEVHADHSLDLLRLKTLFKVLKELRMFFGAVLKAEAIILLSRVCACSHAPLSVL
jgi:hypothetical protein